MSDDKTPVSVSATVTMVFEVDSDRDMDEESLEMTAHDLLDGFFSTYPTWLDGSVIRERPEINEISTIEWDF